MKHPEGLKNLYNPQGYEGLTSDDRIVEMYVNTVIDHDLEVHYCISVRHRPYLNDVTVNGKIPEDMEEVRDYLFVSIMLLKRWPEQTEPEYRAAWMGTPYHPFDGFPSQRDVLSAFMDFIEGAPSNPCTPIEARWCPRCGDCCCEANWSDLASPECPLHGMDSNHSSH